MARSDVRTPPPGADDYETRQEVRRQSASSGLGTAFLWLLGIGVVVAIGLAIWAWVDDDTAGPEAGVSVSEITENQGAFVGQTVTVSAEVEEVSPFTAGIDASETDAGIQRADAPGTAFVLGGDAPGQALLVVDIGSAAQFVDEGDVVQVSGTVRTFDPAQFNDAFGVSAREGTWFDAAFFQGWDGRPVIVAQSVDPTVPTEG